MRVHVSRIPVSLGREICRLFEQSRPPELFASTSIYLALLRAPPPPPTTTATKLPVPPSPCDERDDILRVYNLFFSTSCRRLFCFFLLLSGLVIPSGFFSMRCVHTSHSCAGDAHARLSVGLSVCLRSARGQLEGSWRIAGVGSLLEKTQAGVGAGEGAGGGDCARARASRRGRP